MKIVPDILKVPKVTPILTGADKSEISSQRPVSVLSSFFHNFRKNSL